MLRSCFRVLAEYWSWMDRFKVAEKRWRAGCSILPSHTSLPSLMRNPPRRPGEVRNSVVISSPNFCFRVLAMLVALSHPGDALSTIAWRRFEFQPELNRLNSFRTLQIATEAFHDQAFRRLRRRDSRPAVRGQGLSWNNARARRRASR